MRETFTDFIFKKYNIQRYDQLQVSEEQLANDMEEWEKHPHQPSNSKVSG